MSATGTVDPSKTAPTRREELLDRFERLTEWPLLLLSLAMVPILVLPLVVEVSDSTDAALETCLWFIWAVFLVELTIRLALAERRFKFLRRNWLDVLIVAVPFLRPLRIARSARAIRMLRLARVTPFFARAIQSVHDILRRRGLQYVLLVGVFTVLGSSGLILMFEKDEGSIDDYGTALWWAMTTVTTVGYGDTIPQTPEGRGVAIFLMLVGIAFFSWLTANVAAFLVELGSDDESVVTTRDIMQKLDRLEEEIRSLRQERGTTID